jgi:anti-sigma factor RsiW
MRSKSTCHTSARARARPASPNDGAHTDDVDLEAHALPCGQNAFDVDLLADGELDADAAADVRAHVARCPDCRQQWDQTISVRRLLSAAVLTRTRSEAPSV